MSFMATETLHPDGVGYQATFNPVPGAPNWDCCDEDPANDGDYVNTSTSDTTAKLDSYALENTAILAGATINWVRVYNRTKSQSATYKAYMRTVLRISGTNYYGANQAPSTSFTDYYTEYANNPDTTNPWDPSELDSLEAGVNGYSATHTGRYYIGYCSQVKLVIDYTPAGGGGQQLFTLINQEDY
jgi:hypothetical protein